MNNAHTVMKVAKLVVDLDNVMNVNLDIHSTMIPITITLIVPNAQVIVRTAIIMV